MVAGRTPPLEVVSAGDDEFARNVALPGAASARTNSDTNPSIEDDAALAQRLQMEETRSARRPAPARREVASPRTPIGALGSYSSHNQEYAAAAIAAGVAPSIVGALQSGEGGEDLEYALSMQMSELQQANLESEANWRMRRQEQNAAVTMYDPIWGEVRLMPYARDEPRSRRWGRQITRMTFGCLPCTVMTFGCWFALEKRPTRKHVITGWCRLLISWSFLFAAAQTVSMAHLCVKYGMADLSENPMAGPSFIVFNDWGAKNAPAIRYRDEWWRCVTAIFVHAGWFHLLSNVTMQLHLGSTLEFVWGHVNYLLLYMISGFGGWVTSSIFHQNSIGVGSSGALCGIVGAWVPFLVATWNQTLPRDRQARNAQLGMVIISIVILIPLSFAPMVDAAAHLGGLVIGAALATALFAGLVQTQAYRIAMRAAGMLLTAALWAGGLYAFMTMDVDKRLLYLCPANGCPDN